MAIALPKIIVIGAGQAGLSTAYHLQQLGLPFELIDANELVGDSWRQRWDSLRLFSPARYSSLPGWAFPCDPMHLAGKEEVADYLEAYAKKFGFPLRMETQVESVAQSGEGFQLNLRQNGSPLTAKASHVVIASGAFGKPYVPVVEGEANAELFQLHVAHYKNPSQVPAGPVLVVGTGASGTQIAAELATTRKVYLSGPETSHLPRRFLGKDLYWWLYATGVMSIRRESSLGRRMLSRSTGADFLIGKSLKTIVQESGLIRRGMLTGFLDGLPQFVDGESYDDISSILWATGYKNDFGWLPAAALNENGQPLQTRGAAHNIPGLYFVGQRFMYRADSSNIAGVSRDAAHIAGLIALQIAPRK